jgi:GxxExxY protein
MNADELSGIVIGCAIRIHSGLGPGLYESVYETLLVSDLTRRRLNVERQKSMPFEFDGIVFEKGFHADLVVEGKLLVEIKSIAQIGPAQVKQTLTYMRLLDIRLGLILNFGAASMRDGIKRVINSNGPSRTSTTLRTLREKNPGKQQS